jgi:hypothetical protein
VRPKKRDLAASWTPSSSRQKSLLHSLFARFVGPLERRYINKFHRGVKEIFIFEKPKFSLQMPGFFTLFRFVSAGNVSGLSFEPKC